MIREPKTLRKNMFELTGAEKVDYVPAGWQCKTCTKLKRLCDFDFKSMPVVDTKTYLPCIIIDCTERVVGESI